MEYQLIKSPFQLDETHSAIERILLNRGIALTDILHYLSTTDNDICSPTLLDNIQKGVKLLMSHIVKDDLIFIQIDSDCDGYTSAAALLNYLYKLFPAYTTSKISYRIHSGKQHGILPDTIPEGVKLVIAPDSSSNDYDEHKILAERGIDVLVIDHHEAEKISEYACIINNQLCDYPTKSLSGVGMVYKFCSYIDSLMGTNHADSILDLVALGMTADMMDIRDFETKHLIGKGIQNVQNPFFSKMAQTQNFSISKQGGLSPFTIGFYIAPQVNATIRMGTVKEKMMLFESMLEFKAYEQVPVIKKGVTQYELRVDRACRNCVNIKSKQQKARDTTLAKIETFIQQNNLLANKILVVPLNGFDADKNLTGLIANQLMSKYQRPVLLLNEIQHTKEDGSLDFISWEGSGRGYNKSTTFTNLKKFLNDSGLVMYAEGHANAMGVGILNENLKKFIEYSNDKLANVNFSPAYFVDFIYDWRNINPADVLNIADFKTIWGQELDEPYIAIENIHVSTSNLHLMSPDKNPTLKIVLPNGIELIKFGITPEEFEALKSDGGCVTINVVGKFGKSEWRGTVTPQVLIEDYEIMSRTQYYF